jgi:hypothetical protein
MPGASKRTRQVTVLNANWIAGPDGDDGRFELMLVTQDGEQHSISPSAAATNAILALAQANTILLWDPEDRTLIAANVVGTWLATTGVTRATVTVGP